MAYQRGSLKQVERKEGLTWVLRYRVTKPDGNRVEGTPLVVGLVCDHPTQADAQREVDRLGLRARINVDQPQAGPLKFDALAEFYQTGIVHEKISVNPVENVETQCKSTYSAIIIVPQQTLAILKSLASILHFVLVLTVAATALRASEILSLRWSDIEWRKNRIRVNKRWAHGGGDGETKTVAS